MAVRRGNRKRTRPARFENAASLDDQGEELPTPPDKSAMQDPRQNTRNYMLRGPREHDYGISRRAQYHDGGICRPRPLAHEGGTLRHIPVML
jgi:hypothetical protein